MSVRASRLVPLASSLLVAASCANLDGLSGGVPDGGGSSDASVASADAGLTPDAHALTDAPARDTASDAGADATRSSDASDAGRWCSQQSPSTFCADYDTALVDGWSIDNEVNGTIAFDPVSFVSAPHAAHSTTSATLAHAFSQASLDYIAVVTGTNIHLEYELRLGQVAAGAGLKTGGFAISSPNGSQVDYGVFIIVTSGATFIEETIRADGGQQLYIRTALSVPPTPGQWARIQMDVVLPSLAGPPPTATVHVGNALALDHHPLAGGGANGPVTINAGLELYPTVDIGVCDVDIDNVLLVVSP